MAVVIMVVLSSNRLNLANYQSQLKAQKDGIHSAASRQDISLDLNEAIPYSIQSASLLVEPGLQGTTTFILNN
jgi:hypothetical protein